MAYQVLTEPRTASSPLEPSAAKNATGIARPARNLGECAVSAGTSARVAGLDAGKIWMSDDFDAPLPDDIVDEFYG